MIRSLPTYISYKLIYVKFCTWLSYKRSTMRREYAVYEDLSTAFAASRREEMCGVVVVLGAWGFMI